MLNARLMMDQISSLLATAAPVTGLDKYPLGIILVGLVGSWGFLYALGYVSPKQDVLECESSVELHRHRKHAWRNWRRTAVLIGALCGVIIGIQKSSWLHVAVNVPLLIAIFAVFSIGYPIGISKRIHRCRRELGVVSAGDTTDESDETPPIHSDIRNIATCLAIFGGLGLFFAATKILSIIQVPGFVPESVDPAAPNTTWDLWYACNSAVLGVLMVIGGAAASRGHTYGRNIILIYCAVGLARLPIHITLNPTPKYGCIFGVLLVLWYVFQLCIFARKNWRDTLERPKAPAPAPSFDRWRTTARGNTHQSDEHDGDGPEADKIADVDR